MLSFMNEIDSCLLLPLCVLYEIQNQIFSNTLKDEQVDFATSSREAYPREGPRVEHITRR